MIPGKGESGIPYIHIKDVIQIFLRCIALHNNLSNYDIFLASQNGSVSHSQLFPIIKTGLNDQGTDNPIYISKSLAKIALGFKAKFGRLTGGINFEQPWMLKYTDQPWIVNNDYTRKKLNWGTNPDLEILERLPLILKYYEEQKNQWMSRNKRRISGRYIYISDQNGV